MSQSAALQAARTLVLASTRITVLTGAGISTAAGIPDFRGPQGVWTLDPAAERMSSLSHYLADEQVRRLAWQRRASSAALAATPTAAHWALVDLEASGRLIGLITQNTDGLHLAAGHDPALVHEMHGNIRRWRCESCGEQGPLVEMAQRVLAGDSDPRCPTCGGITRATVILFGELLDTVVLQSALDAVEGCDLLLAIGSTLVVQPVATFVGHAVKRRARLIIVNAAATPFDDDADVLLPGDIQEILPVLLTPPPDPDGKARCPTSPPSPVAVDGDTSVDH